MSDKKKNRIQEKSAEKKALILKTGKNRRLWWALAGVVFVLLLGAGVLLATQNTEKEGRTDTFSGSQGSSTLVTYPVALFSDGKARHFRYEAGDAITVQYFILKSADGVIRAAFDACDVCWHAGKGYKQSGDAMVCLNCGQKFPSNRVNEVKGGCNPAPLERQIQGVNVVLRVQDILGGKKYFDFSKRG
jgi:uncharacterized membrane protein